MKIITLREEDERLLLDLHTFIYLDAEFIRKHIYKSYTPRSHSLYRRLRVLEDAGYIKSYFLPTTSDNRPSKVFTLTKHGVEAVHELRGVTHWRRHWSERPQLWYLHALMLAEIAKAFEDKAPEKGIHMTEYISEQRAFMEFTADNSPTKKKTAIRPDGIVILKAGDTHIALMVEMERSYTTKEKTISKVDQYNEFFSRKAELMDTYVRKVAFEYDPDFYRVVFIAGTQAKADKLLRDLVAEATVVPIYVAAKEDVELDPLGKIYRMNTKPDEYVTI